MWINFMTVVLLAVEYGAKFVPLFIKQIQRFANKHNLLCKKNSTFKQTQTDLQIQNSIWEKMQRYGQICIVCYNCETHLPFYDQMWLDFLTNACRQIFSHGSNWFSHKCNPNSRWRCWSIYAKHRFTFSRNTADQHEWGTGEFLSYYFYN